ncbi:MAG: hypothetical protein FWD37_02980 [Methanomassiliicoccaceae archaeon]|nr:hypothetical protein [Methanomassiliicoccaceae archaeon]
MSKIEDEIDEIRLNIYEKIKDMTPQERVEYYRKSGERTAKKYGFKIYYSVEEADRDRAARISEHTSVD